MIHPSYKELMNKVNDTMEEGQVLMENRYDLVMATATRARQINDGAVPMVDVKEPNKTRNLSIAVREFDRGLIHITNLNSPIENTENES